MSASRDKARRRELRERAAAASPPNGGMDKPPTPSAPPDDHADAYAAFARASVRAAAAAAAGRPPRRRDWRRAIGHGAAAAGRPPSGGAHRREDRRAAVYLQCSAARAAAAAAAEVADADGATDAAAAARAAAEVASNAAARAAAADHAARVADADAAGLAADAADAIRAASACAVDGAARSSASVPASGAAARAKVAAVLAEGRAAMAARRSAAADRDYTLAVAASANAAASAVAAANAAYAAAGAIQRARHMRDMAAAAGARQASNAGPAPPRPPAGWMGFEGAAAGAAEEVDGDDDEEPESGYQYFVRRIKDGEFAGLYHGDWRLPGGGANYSTCGEYLRVKGCAHDDHAGLGVEFDSVRVVENSCRRIDCPVCFEAAIARKSARALNAMYGFVGLRKSGLLVDEGACKRLPLHGVLSAPESMYPQLATKDGMQKANAFVRRRLLAMGFEAAAVFFHPFRFDKKNGGRPYYSPHFHVIVFGYSNPARIAELFEADGWIYKYIRAIRSLEHLYMTVCYILSHAGVATLPSGRTADMVRYFGLLGARKFGRYDLAEAQLDTAHAVDRIIGDRCKGAYPLLPASVRAIGGAAGASAPAGGGGAAAGAAGAEDSAWRPVVSARLFEPEDKPRRDAEGNERTQTLFPSMREVLGARVEGFELAGRADYDRLLDRLGVATHRDNPAFRPINPNDLKRDDDDELYVPDEARQRAQGHVDGARLPPARLLVVRVDYVRAGGLASADGGPAAGDTTDPTKPAPRYFTIVLKPTLANLCLICRRPLRVMCLDDTEARLPVHEYEAGEIMLVPRRRLKEFLPDDGPLPLYAKSDGHADYEGRLLVTPQYMAAYPPHVQSSLRRRIAASEFSYQVWVQEGKRPSAEVVESYLCNERERLRVLAPGLTVDDRPA